MGKTSSLKVYGSGGASSHAGKYGYSGYNDDEKEYNVPGAETVQNPLAPYDPYYDNKRTALGEQKASDLKDLDAYRVHQRQEAAINNELLMKYLPQLNKASGLTGLGVAQSANVDALSRYQTNLGNIEKNYRRGVSDIESAYRTDLAKIDDAERAEIKGDQDSAYGLAWEYIASGGITDKDSLDRYLDGIDDTVSEKQLAQLKALGDSMVSESEKTTEGKYGTNVGKYIAPETNGNAELEAATNLETVGSVVKVNGNGTTFVLESNGIADDAAQEAASGNDIKNGDVFYFNKGIYLKQNGRVYALSGTGGNYNTSDYSAMYKYLTGTVPTTNQSTQNVPNAQAPEQNGTQTTPDTNSSNESGVDMSGFTPADTSDTTLISNFNRLNPKEGEVVTVMDMYTNEVKVMKKDGVLYKVDDRPIVELSASNGTVKGKLGEQLNRWWHGEAYDAAKKAGEGNVAYVKERANGEYEYFTIKDGKLYKVDVTERIVNKENLGDLANYFKGE